LNSPGVHAQDFQLCALPCELLGTRPCKPCLIEKEIHFLKPLDYSNCQTPLPWMTCVLTSFHPSQTSRARSNPEAPDCLPLSPCCPFNKLFQNLFSLRSCFSFTELLTYHYDKDTLAPNG
ncbi:hypothetical protein GOODEAATRI_012197, partial [Goodea atripinnis]